MTALPTASPRRPLTVTLLLSACAAIFIEYWEYSKAWYGNPHLWDPMLNGTEDAPAQYRVLVVKSAGWMAQHLHMGVRHGITLIDFVSLVVAMFVLRSLLERSAAWRNANATARWFAAAAYLALIQFFLAWLTWYQRPETLANAALLALALLLTSRRIGPPGNGGAALTAACLVLVGVLQGFTRADVGFTFHAGVALVCLTARGRDFALPRWLQFAASTLACGAALAAQLYLMRVVYPHAHYRADTPVFELLLNFKEHLRAVPFVLYMIPLVWLVVQLMRKRVPVTSAQAGLLTGTAIFFVLWCMVGKIDEVRIFLPFAFALTPLLVEAALARVAAAEAGVAA
jgi:hypothetical protein